VHSTLHFNSFHKKQINEAREQKTNLDRTPTLQTNTPFHCTITFCEVKTSQSSANPQFLLISLLYLNFDPPDPNKNQISVHLFDRNLSRLSLLRLGNNHTQNPVLHRSLDLFLIYPDREGKATRELPNRAFRNPVFGFRFL